jgi:acyl carrier protein
MQEQTARVHKLFLEGQIAAHRSLQALLGVTAEPTTSAEEEGPAALPPSMGFAAVHTQRVLPSAPVTVAAPAAPAPPPAGGSRVVLDVVAQATGYPVETLSLDMAMEADLGIDSIKRVEILSMLSKLIPGAPSVNPEKLGGLRTLRDVATFIGVAEVGGERAAKGDVHGTGGGENGVAHVHPDAPPSLDLDHRGLLLEVVAELTGYPRETLSLEMDMEADLGIDSIKRVEILSLLGKRIPLPRPSTPRSSRSYGRWRRFSASCLRTTAHPRSARSQRRQRRPTAR